jgi:glucosamine--fructose-6-phosphate aminotransferase (isomerizing)
MSLLDELREQPEAVARLLREEVANARQIAASLRVAGVSSVFVAARGSSDHAALYAKYLFGSMNALPVALAAPALFTHYAAPPRLAGALVVGISQSGQSPDIVRVLAEARRQGAPTLAITNDPGSPLAAEAGMVLATRSGPELAIAATKTYTGQLAAVAMLATALAGDDAASGALARLPEWIAAALSGEGEVERAASSRARTDRAVVLGRGYNYATAAEWSLKLKELAAVFAEPYSTADFRHGPMAIVGEGLAVLAAVPSGAVFAEVLATLEHLVTERGVDLVAISDEPRALALAASPLEIPAGIPEWLSPIVAIVPAQLFALHLARARGFDVEAPRGLTKVTRTW